MVSIWKLLGLLLLLTPTCFGARNNKQVQLQSDDSQQKEELLERTEFLASLRTGYGGHTCSGTLIAPRVVLTAAHCLTYRPLPSVEFGRYRRRGSNEPNTEIHKTVDSFIHEDYDRRTRPDLNVGLLILDKESERTPIKLASSDDCFYGQLRCPLQLFGWGTPPKSSYPSNTLQESFTRSFDHNSCQEILGSTIITKMSICGGEIVDGKYNSCSGDSGGPVILNGELVGIVAMGIGCGGFTIPGVYTSIPQLQSWIEDKVGVYTPRTEREPGKSIPTVQGPVMESDGDLDERNPDLEMEANSDVKTVMNPDAEIEVWSSPECDCTQDGMSGSVSTNMIGCKQHLLKSGDSNVFCMTVGGVECQGASPFERFPGAAWRFCSRLQEIRPEPVQEPGSELDLDFEEEIGMSSEPVQETDLDNLDTVGDVPEGELDLDFEGELGLNAEPSQESDVDDIGVAVDAPDGELDLDFEEQLDLSAEPVQESDLDDLRTSGTAPEGELDLDVDKELQLTTELGQEPAAEIDLGLDIDVKEFTSPDQEPEAEIDLGLERQVKESASPDQEPEAEIDLGLDKEMEESTSPRQEPGAETNLKPENDDDRVDFLVQEPGTEESLELGADDGKSASPLQEPELDLNFESERGVEVVDSLDKEPETEASGNLINQGVEDLTVPGQEPDSNLDSASISEPKSEDVNEPAEEPESVTGSGFTPALEELPVPVDEPEPSLSSQVESEPQVEPEQDQEPAQESNTDSPLGLVPQADQSIEPSNEADTNQTVELNPAQEAEPVQEPEQGSNQGPETEQRNEPPLPETNTAPGPEMDSTPNAGL